MNAYITLGGCKYKTSAATWAPKYERAVSVHRLFSGNRDVTFGPSGMSSWEGELIVPVTGATGFGDINDVRALYAVGTTLVLIDHYGISFNVALVGTIAERSLVRKWDAATNEFYIPVILLMVSLV
jgi:hypothetical protein